MTKFKSGDRLSVFQSNHGRLPAIDCTVHKASEEILLAILKLEPSLSLSVMSVSMSGDVPTVEINIHGLTKNHGC